MKEKIINIIKSIGIIILAYFLLMIMYSLLQNYMNSFLAEILSYIPVIALIITIYKKDFITNYKNFNIRQLKKYILIFIISFILSHLAKELIIYLTSYVNTTEASNISLLNNYKLFYFISAIIIVPFEEELLWRLNFKSIFKNKWLFSIIMGLVFSVLHLTSFAFPEIYYLLPYFISSFILCYIYFDSNNILYSYIFHAFNNILAIIIILIGG